MKKLRETNFREWANTATQKEIEKFLDTLPKGEIYDYTIQTWGHAFTPKTLNRFIHFGAGFFNFYFHRRKPKAGDIIKLKCKDNTVGNFKILHIQFERDPNDMFWAYVAGIE